MSSLSPLFVQTELGERVGVSNRVIAYYEHDDAQPPGAMLVDLARALRVSADELLGLKDLPKNDKKTSRKVLRRMERIEDLPPSKQTLTLRTIDTLITGPS